MTEMTQTRIQALGNEALIKSTERVVETERKIVQVLIWHLQEIQDRKLYLSMGYESLYKCLIGHFKMSDTTAYGRIKVLKILEEVPNVSESLKTGELNISSIALAHSFIEKHEKTTGENLSPEDKADLIENLKNKTTIEVKEFFARCNAEMTLPYDEIRPLTESHSQIRSTVKNELIEKINYAKSLLSHEYINPPHEELLQLAFEALIEKTKKKKGIYQKNPKPKVNRSKKDISEVGTNPEHSTQSLTDGNSRYVPRDVKRFILKRAKYQCEHIHSTGKRCTSRFQLQLDHVLAYSKGGRATLENMQLLCRVHNAYKSDH